MHLMIPRAFRAFAMDNKGNRAALLLICWTIFWIFFIVRKGSVDNVEIKLIL